MPHNEGEWMVDGALHALIIVEGQELEMRIIKDRIHKR
jgi:hypothetical protein